MIQEIIVFGVDEKLGRGAVRVRGARHGDGAAFVSQTVVGFIVNRRSSFLLLHVCGKAAALDHEVGYHAVKNGAVVKSSVHIRQKILNGFRRFVRI